MILAHGNLSKVQRAFIGADLYRGRSVVRDHTIVSAARTVGTSTTLVAWALQRLPQREAIEAGLLPLVPPPTPAARAERAIARLVRALGHARVTELLATHAPAAMPAAPVDDNDTSVAA
jgi:hypothetical protein